jgi:hypothetical protein
MINFNRQCLHKTHAAMDTMPLVTDVHDTLLQAMLHCTALLVTLRHFVVTNDFQDGNWEVLTLCLCFETDFLRNYKSVFKRNLVPNVAKNVADLINIKQMYIDSLFRRAYLSFDFEGWVGEIPPTCPNARYRSIVLTYYI